MRVLHAGCGGNVLPPWLSGEETRLDIDPDMKPDIVASITDMGDIGTFDVVYCMHTLEHLVPCDVTKALQEFLRVLGKDGTAIVVVPNLEGIEPTDDVVYTAPCGPITGHDMYYGHSRYAETNPYMRHCSGFVAKTLKAAFDRAGFNRAACTADGNFNLIGVGIK